MTIPNDAERVQYVRQQMGIIGGGPIVDAINRGIEAGQTDIPSIQLFRERVTSPAVEQAAPDAYQKEVDRLIATGVSPERAQQIASGRLDLRTNPQTGGVQLFDQGTMPVGVAIGGGEDLSVPADDFVNPVPPEGARTLAEGTGSIQQIVEGSANSAAQILGADPIFPDQVTSNVAVQNLGRDTAIALSQDGQGRTSNLRYQAFLETQARPMNGEAEARARVGETIEQLSSRLREAEAFANDPAADRTLRRGAQQRVGELRRLRQRWADLVSGQQAPAADRTPSPGETITLSSGKTVRVLD